MAEMHKGPIQSSIPNSVATELYRKMLGVYFIEERLKIFTRQGKVSFHASTRGHEKVQIGTVMLMKPGQDWFFTYYREKAVAYALGMPAKDIFLHMLSREGDPSSNGRNMPEHFSSRESETGFRHGLHRHAVSCLPSARRRLLKKDGKRCDCVRVFRRRRNQRRRIFRSAELGDARTVARAVPDSEQRIRDQRSADGANAVRQSRRSPRDSESDAVLSH